MTLYTKREGHSMADLGVLPNNTDVWMVDEMVAAYVPVTIDYMLAMVTYLMESGQRTKLRDIRKAVDVALGVGETP